MGAIAVSMRAIDAPYQRVLSKLYQSSDEENDMAKGMDKQKETKKKPTKTLKEKRAEKASKKG